MNMEMPPVPEKVTIDLSSQFLEALQGEEDYADFRRRARKLGAVRLCVRFDLTRFSGTDSEARGVLRKLKAFLETPVFDIGQERSVVVVATDEQVALEPNVFSSGVEHERV